MSADTAYSTLQSLQQDLKSGNTTCEEVTRYYLQNIKEHKHLNAFLEVFEEEALERARAIDQKIQEGTAGKLAGLVIGLKDVLACRDHGLQASSKILDNFESQFTGTAVQRLLDEDAVIIGRQNCDEFAMGSSTENSAFSATKNPVDPDRVPGGSSGGSAAAVGAGLCMASLGSDTGGSVRQPAAFCGIWGLKPTYSRISRYGLIAYGSSFDCIGVLANNAEDTALILEAISGGDEYDSTVSQKEVPAYSQNLDFNKKVRIGYIKEGLESEGLQNDIKENTRDALNFLEQEGHEVNPVNFNLLDYMLPTYYLLSTAEASTNLSRYDGVRYGYRSPESQDLLSMYKNTRTEGFGEEVKRRIMLGTFALSASYYDAYFTKAQKVRRLIKEKTEELLENCDFLVLPTTPTTAFSLGENTADPIAMYLADLFTVQANLAGIPALSVPNGKDKNGLPIGLQIMSKNFSEAELLAFARYLTNNRNS